MCTFNENNENIRRLLRRLRRRRSGGDRLGMVRIKHGDWRVIDVVPLLFQFRDVKFRELTNSLINHRFKLIDMNSFNLIILIMASQYIFTFICIQ